ncbi:hypothetical protein [uncultured Duncaniella sp.]|uniref:hypothetical protein n=1 Tax=uncultured Duncaniella sp. TaxID=2768039 RepID=UPI0025A96A30|nr:hypothetical protein [uncultured Duncaniella sp.]
MMNHEMGSNSMYWKQGFYDSPVDGSVEITMDAYMELLDGQAEGLSIVEDESGYPVLRRHEPTIEELIDFKIQELEEYDRSSAVNTISIGGVSGWLDKATRVGLMNSISVEQAKGRTETSIWLGDHRFVMPITEAVGILRQIEIYTVDCNNATHEHAAAIRELRSKEDIEAYDFRTGYPSHPVFPVALDDARY